MKMCSMATCLSGNSWCRGLNLLVGDWLRCMTFDICDIIWEKYYLSLRGKLREIYLFSVQYPSFMCSIFDNAIDDLIVLRL